MLWLLVALALADDTEICKVERPVSMDELKTIMKVCTIPVGTRITIYIEESVAQEQRPGIGFHSNDSALTPNSKETLDGIASVLTIRKKMNIKVIGYSDGQEKGDLLDLSLRRAQAAADYLVEKGIEAARVSVEAAGAESPIDTTDTAEARARNRRVEFIVSTP